MRFILAFAAVSAAGSGRADDWVFEARLSAVERREAGRDDTIDALRKRVANLEGRTATAATAATAPVAPRATAPCGPGDNLAYPTIVTTDNTGVLINTRATVRSAAGTAGHTHTCRNGHTWDHSMDGGSHRCPTCGESQFVQDSGPRRVSAAPSRGSAGGCPTGGCPTGGGPPAQSRGSAGGCPTGGCPTGGCPSAQSRSYGRAGLFGRLRGR